MKKLTIIIMIIVLFAFVSNSNAAVIEMNFYDDTNNRHQSLEFDSTINNDNSYHTNFGNIQIYYEDKLCELDPPHLREYQSSLYKYEENKYFWFNIRTILINSEYPWIEGDWSNIQIKSASIHHFGYNDINKMTPELIEDILNGIVNKYKFFKYSFNGTSNENRLDYSHGYTTLTSWNYKPSAVPIPPSVWMFSSGLIGLISFKKFRY